jgi:O-antigen/teichoic acid export membrane protein
MLLTFGLPDYLGRKAAAGADQRRLSATALLLSVGIGAITVGPYLLVIGSLDHITPSARLIMVAYALAVPLLVYGYCLNGISAGAGRWKRVGAIRVLPQLFAVLVLIGLIWWQPADLVLAVGITLVATAAVVPIAIGLPRQALPHGIPRVSELRESLGFGLRIWVAGSVALLNQRIDLLLVTVLLLPTDIGYYAVGTTLATTLTAAANAVAYPARNAIVRGELEAVSQASAVATSTALLGAVCAAPLLPWLIQLVLGSDFLPATLLFAALLLAQVPLASSIVLTQALVGHGRPGTPIIGEGVALAVAVAATLALTPAWGGLGAVCAIALSRVVNLTILLVLTRKLIRPDSAWRYFVPSPSAIRGVLRFR